MTSYPIYSRTKIVMIGDAGVGKSTLLLWMIRKEFVEKIDPTIGASFSTLTVSHERNRIDVWDTAGQERFRALSGMYYRGSLGAICVFDVGNMASFNAVRYWIDLYQTENGPDVPIVIVANKSDRPDWAITRNEMDLLSNDTGYPVVLTSCKSGSGVEPCFELMLEHITFARKMNKNRPDNIIELLPTLPSGDQLAESTVCSYCNL